MTTLYADPSALVKLYVAEEGSDEMLALVRAADAVASSVLVWPEVLATFARRAREQLLGDEEHAMLAGRFEQDHQGLVTVALDGRVLELVRRLVRDHPLRSADAVHLASALFLAEEGLAVRFACSDRELLGAARAERLDAVDPAARG